MNNSEIAKHSNVSCVIFFTYNDEISRSVAIGWSDLVI